MKQRKAATILKDRPNPDEASPKAQLQAANLIIEVLLNIRQILKEKK